MTRSSADFFLQTVWSRVGPYKVYNNKVSRKRPTIIAFAIHVNAQHKIVFDTRIPYNLTPRQTLNISYIYTPTTYLHQNDVIVIVGRRVAIIITIKWSRGTLYVLLWWPELCSFASRLHTRRVAILYYVFSRENKNTFQSISISFFVYVFAIFRRAKISFDP